MASLGTTIYFFLAQNENFFLNFCLNVSFSSSPDTETSILMVSFTTSLLMLSRKLGNKYDTLDNQSGKSIYGAFSGTQREFTKIK